MNDPPPQRFNLWTVLSTLTFVSLFCGMCIFAFGQNGGNLVLSQVAGVLTVGGLVAGLVWGVRRLLGKK